MQKTVIIAELAGNHMGSIENAKRMIDIAAVAGCDFVKFQKRTPELAIPQNQQNITRTTKIFGELTYLEYRKRLEFGEKEYKELDWYCSDKNIGWGVSVWDLESLDFISRVGDPSFLKIPSALIINRDLFIETAKYCDQKNLCFIFSTGMSTEEEIDNAFHWTEACIKDLSQVTMMICNSSYPASVDELNLSRINTVKKKYKGINFGYSGHERLLGTSVACIYLGYTVIERHFTLSRDVENSDAFCSLEPQGLFKLVSGVRELERAIGDSALRIYDSELPFRKKLRGY